MSKLGKGLLVLTVLSFLVGASVRYIVIDPGYYIWIPFAVGLLFWMIEIFVDRKVYAEFMSLKTTKHGLNMGTMIILAVLLLAAINFVAVKRDKKFDLTEEKLNSLSDQTVKLMDGLKENIEIKAFFRSDSMEEEQRLSFLRHYINLMKDKSDKIDFQIVDPLKRPDLVKQFEVVTSGTVVFKYNGKTTSVTDVDGITEEALANALLKVTREKNKVLYALVGHGEIGFSDEKELGASFLKKALQDASYEVNELNLIEKKSIPENADLLMILGPKTALLDFELSAIDNYAKNGGRLFITIDPAQKHGLQSFLKKFGINFTNRFVVDQVGQQIAGSAALAVGMEYSPTSDITKDIKEKRIMLFNLASSLERDEKAPEDYKFEELVKSSPASFVTDELSARLKFDEKKDKRGASVIGMSVVGTLASTLAKADDKSNLKPFSLVVFSDSDFLSNQLFFEQINRDITLNSVAFLAKDEDLISIRPKTPIGNKLTMTNTQAELLVLGVYLPVPIIFLIMSGVIWYRRRGA